MDVSLLMQIKALRANLLPRLRLLRTALSRRFIYTDIVQMARVYGLEYRDVIADVEPFEFVEAILGCDNSSCPDFKALAKDARLFAIDGVSAETNSEPSVARFVGKLVFHLNPHTVVELGSFSGWTSAHIALALQSRNNGGRLYCVEMHDQHLDALNRNLARYSLDNAVELVRGMSLDQNVIEKLPGSIDLVFLDTSHAYPATYDEMRVYLPRLTERGCFVLHDSVSAAGVRRSLAEFSTEFRRISFATEAGNGVTVMTRPALFKAKAPKPRND
jgi:predicted O-methyltransferase YrrM